MLSSSIWKTVILPILATDYYHNNRTNPIYNLRLTSKYFRDKVVTVDACKSLLYLTGLSKIVFDPSIKLTNLVYIKEFVLIAATKNNMVKYDFEWASRNRKINILEWWLFTSKKSGIKLEYSEDIFNKALYHRHDDILDWWIESNLELKIDLGIIDDAFRVGYNGLKLWQKSGYEQTLPNYAINRISSFGHVKILEWWGTSKLDLGYSEDAIDDASKYGHIHVLDWWLSTSKNYKLELKYSVDAMDCASRNGRTDVLQWWANSGLELKYTSYAIDIASACKNIKILKWWKSSGLELKYTNYAIDKASANGHIKILKWWKKSGLELKYSNATIDYILTKPRNSQLRRWWNNISQRKIE